MLLTRDQFDKARASNQLRIALIGMSNIGKSHWTRQIITKHGFHAYEVDTGIQTRLNMGSMEQIAEWLGPPYENGYSDRAARYLRHEGELTLNASAVAGNLVLDTTGSVIHLDKATKNDIQIRYLTVYLKAPKSATTILVERFNQTPKPLIWGRNYHKQDKLSEYESMLACYPVLLSKRAKLYENLADVTLDVEILKDTHTTDFLTALREKLPV